MVVKDLGGMNNLLLVLDYLSELSESSISVLLIANGKSAEHLATTKRDFIVAENTVSLMQQYAPPKLLVASMCSGGGVGRDLVPLLREQGTVVVALQDFWGARLEKEWRDPKYHPDHIVTNDAVGKAIIQRMWPDFSSDRIAVTGFPNLDRYAKIDTKKESAEVRGMLGLTRNLPIVLFFGQGEGTAHALQELIMVLEDMSPCYLIPRPHPRAMEKKEMPLWQKALARFRRGVVVDWFNQCKNERLIAACAQRRGVVVSMFSTTLMEAAAVRAPAISILYPESGMRLMQKEIPGLLQNPVVEGGSAAFAGNRRQLRKSIHDALHKKLDLEKAQREQFPLDGRNAERVTRLLLSFF